MPTRIIREGILTSETINSLSERAELFYRRLMQVADDYGRYWASETIIRANCYQLRLKDVSEADVKQMLNECVAAKILMIYGGEKYLEIQKFGQQTRSRSKFPEPTREELLNHSLIKCKADDKQMSSLVGDGDVVGVGDGIIDKGVEIFEALESRLGVLYHRKPGTISTYAEQSALSEISRRPDVMTEVAEIESFQEKADSYFPQSLSKLLTTWQETIDRARTHELRKKKNATNRPTAPDRNAGTFNSKPLSDAAKSKIR